MYVHLTGHPLVAVNANVGSILMLEGKCHKHKQNFTPVRACGTWRNSKVSGYGFITMYMSYSNGNSATQTQPKRLWQTNILAYPAWKESKSVSEFRGILVVGLWSYSEETMKSIITFTQVLYQSSACFASSWTSLSTKGSFTLSKGESAIASRSVP